MKLMFAGDLHGSAFYARRLQELYLREQADKLILLGDLLYHGPRNDLPREYAPKEVIAILNEMKQHILAVRGNCESEVDQMVLQFPVMADYAVLWLDGRMMFLTHGHLFHEQQLPALSPGDVFIQGHTHLRAAIDRGSYFFCNPGSLSIPKGDGIHSYMVYEDGVFTIKDLQAGVLEQLEVAHG